MLVNKHPARENLSACCIWNMYIWYCSTAYHTCCSCSTKEWR